MAKDVHIGKKIQEKLKEARYKKTEFADMINVSRTVVYDIFKRKTIDTGLLKKISEVLNHDFFNYYEQNPSSTAKEIKAEYGYATKSEVADLAHAILKLTKVVERIEEQLPKKKVAVKKRAKK
jgi:transcriptional regulator with XRE-family HTH domain